ncbi:hypothetical protein FXO38_08694 [Capsicum annuum]|nr:hypothetical protein FXO38_08694 [Capsicum annuum]
MAYSLGGISSIEHFLACVSPLLCNEWFPKHSALAFGHLLCLLEKGPVEYHRVKLFMLKALLQHTPMDAAQSPHMYGNCISVGREHFVLGHTLVYQKPLLQSCSLPGSHLHQLGQFESGLAAVEEKILAPQTSFKARSVPLPFAMGIHRSLYFIFSVETHPVSRYPLFKSPTISGFVPGWAPFRGEELPTECLSLPRVEPSTSG